jgi:hypothetical protein
MGKWGDGGGQAAASSSQLAAPEPSPAVSHQEDAVLKLQPSLTSEADLLGSSTPESDEEMGKDTKEEEEEEGEEQAEEEEKETDPFVEDSQDFSGLSPTSTTMLKASFDNIAKTMRALCNFSRGEPQPQNKMADHFQLHQSNMFHPGLSRYRHLAPRFHSNIPIVLLSAVPRHHKSYDYVFVAWFP